MTASVEGLTKLVHVRAWNLFDVTPPLQARESILGAFEWRFGLRAPLTSRIVDLVLVDNFTCVPACPCVVRGRALGSMSTPDTPPVVQRR